MLRRQALWGDFAQPGYFDRGWPPPPLAAVQARWLRWLGLAVAAAGALAFVRFVASHDDPGPGLSGQGWAVLVLAALLAVLLGLHRRRRLAALVRALCEYAVVALLAVLLTLTATGVRLQAHPPQHDQPTSPQQASSADVAADAAKKAPAGCPTIRKLPAWVGCLWRRANLPSISATPPSTTSPPSTTAPPRQGPAG